MRKSIKYMCLTLTLNCVSFLSYGQFEGTVTYDITYSTSDNAILEFIESFPKESTLKIKDEMFRFDQNIVGGGTQSLISNAVDTSTTLILNVLGDAYQVNLDPSEVMQLEQAETFEITETNETKMVAGYKCRKAYATAGNEVYTIYYTDQIKSRTIVPQLSNLKGFPLEYEIEKGNVRMKYTCSNVSSAAIETSDFLVSSSIKEIPFDDFARSFAVRKN